MHFLRRGQTTPTVRASACQRWFVALSLAAQRLRLDSCVLSKWLKRIGLAGLLVLGGASARASTGIDAVSYSAVPALYSAAINITVQGDADSAARNINFPDSTALFRLFYTTPTRYRTMGRAAFTTDSGMVCIRRWKRGTIANGTSTSGWMHHGLLLHLNPGTKYYYLVDRRDSTSGTITTATAAIESVTTLTVPTRPTTGPRFYVNQGTGNDSWDGASPTFTSGSTGPKKTITSALTALAASANSGQNGGVVVAPGIYREKLALNFGTDGFSRFITGDRTNRDSTIIDGSSPTTANGWANTASSIPITRGL